MGVRLVMTVLGAAAVAFYLRFLVALCEESTPHVGGNWMRLKLEADGDVVAGPTERKAALPRTA